MNERSRDVLRDLVQVANDLGPALAPAGHIELLRSITDAAKDLFAAAACSLALLTEDQSELVYYVASGAGAEDVEGMRIGSSQGIAGWVVTSGQPIAIEDTSQDTRFARKAAESTGYVPTSILAMPLETERQMIGVISVLDRSREGRQGDKDMQLLALFARQAALAIENSRVFTDMGRSLFAAAARAGSNGDLTAALDDVAGDVATHDPLMAQLAAHFNELSHAGEAEREAAVRLLGEFVSYMRTRSQWG